MQHTTELGFSRYDVNLPEFRPESRDLEGVPLRHTMHLSDLFPNERQWNGCYLPSEFDRRGGKRFLCIVVEG